MTEEALSPYFAGNAPAKKSTLLMNSVLRREMGRRQPPDRQVIRIGDLDAVHDEEVFIIIAAADNDLVELIGAGYHRWQHLDHPLNIAHSAGASRSRSYPGPSDTSASGFFSK